VLISAYANRVWFSGFGSLVSCLDVTQSPARVQVQRRGSVVTVRAIVVSTDVLVNVQSNYWVVVQLVIDIVTW
jgi:hypothetical protein